MKRDFVEIRNEVILYKQSIQKKLNEINEVKIVAEQKVIFINNKCAIDSSSRTRKYPCQNKTANSILKEALYAEQITRIEKESKITKLKQKVKQKVTEKSQGLNKN